MPEIQPLRPEQVAETRRMIYAVAHQMFHEHGTLEETMAHYAETWPLRDIDDFQQRYSGSDGIFLVMTDGGRIIGSGAIHRLEEKVCEVKRLWFLPGYQGQGLGYRMLMALLDAARERGYEKARLETSPEYQPRAYAFYHQVGFHDIPRYGDDPDDVGMEIEL